MPAKVELAVACLGPVYHRGVAAAHEPEPASLGISVVVEDTDLVDAVHCNCPYPPCVCVSRNELGIYVAVVV